MQYAWGYNTMQTPVICYIKQTLQYKLNTQNESQNTNSEQWIYKKRKRKRKRKTTKKIRNQKKIANKGAM